MRRTPLRRQSAKQAKRTGALRRIAESLGPLQRCEWPEGCHSPPADLHHIRKRSQGGTDERSNLVVLCRRHHDWVERNPREARALGLHKFTGDV